MKTVRVRTTITNDGMLLIEDLPVHVGDEIEVTLRLRSRAIPTNERYPLRGTPYSFTEPFAGVADDWEAGR